MTTSTKRNASYGSTTSKFKPCGGKAFKRHVKRIIYANLKRPIHHNAKYSQYDFLEELGSIAFNGEFAEGGIEPYRDRGAQIPSADSMLYHVKKLDIPQVQEMFDKILEETCNRRIRRIIARAKRRGAVIAIDTHKLPYYGKNAGMVVGVKRCQGTNKAHEWMTVSLVEKGLRFTLAVLPRGPFRPAGQTRQQSRCAR